jgi:hypothetical protein
MEPGATITQIEWEHHHLLRADAIMFWFPCETLCPIVLYELGAWTFRPKPLFIVTHPDYARKNDVIIQTKLERPRQPIVHSLDELAQQAIRWRETRGTTNAFRKTAS